MVKMITIPRFNIEALIKLLEINGKNSKLAAKTALENLLQASENEETLEPEFQELYDDIIRELNECVEDEIDRERIINKFDDIITYRMTGDVDFYIKLYTEVYGKRDNHV